MAAAQANLTNIEKTEIHEALQKECKKKQPTIYQKIKLKTKPWTQILF